MARRARISISTGLAVLALSGAGGAPSDGPDLRALYAAPLADWPAPLRANGRPVRDLAPLTPEPADPALAALGKALFLDRGLSGDGRTACADCHQPAHGLSEPRPSVPVVGRRTPSLQAVNHRQSWGWDGRHQSLEAAFLAPLTHPAEMANPDVTTPLMRVQPVHAQAISAAFGDERLTPDRLTAALRAFLASFDRPSPLDRFLRGDADALSDQEIEGLHLFRTKARCILCHNGPTLADDGFHNLGLSSFGESSEDLGRWRITGQSADVGAFRTPSLRGIARHAPYMHSGHFARLEGVVRFYARGGGEVRARGAAEAARPLFKDAARLAPELRPLDLDEAEIAALVAFLGAL